ncbi:MAG: GTP-binding protein [Promethearchaeota archaeon]
MTDYDYTFKVMMLGDSSVPKASLTIRYITGFYTEGLRLTIGVDFYSKTVSFEGKKAKIQIWDFGGEERFRFLLSQYCRGADSAIFLYDITNKFTLENFSEWLHVVRENAGNIPIILAGTNSELESCRDVSYSEGLQLSRDYNLDGFIEVSHKTGKNVNELFEMVLCSLFQTDTQNIGCNINNARMDLDLSARIQHNRRTNLFKKCINCGAWLEEPGRRHILGKFRVIELRFCCSCFNRFHGKSLSELPPSAIKNIEKHIKQLQN